MNHITHRLPVVLLAAIALFTLAPARAHAGPGYALLLNGTDNYVSASIPALASNYTISAWAYLRSGGDYDTTRLGVLTGTACNNSVEFLIRSETASAADPQYLELGRCGSFSGPRSAYPVPLNQWVHLAVSVSSNRSVHYCINGTNAGYGSIDSGYNLTLGPAIHLGDNAIRHFNGLLDEVQIWSRVLSPAEIQTNMNGALTGSEADLVAYWPFDEGVGNTVINRATATGSACNGALVTHPNWVRSDVGWVPTLQLNGPNPLTNECHAAFTDPGAVVSASPAAIAAGYAHSVALKADGTVVGWGQNDNGQANGAAAGGNNIAIAAGNYHSVALKADGTVVGWGRNDTGQANGAAAGGNNVAIAAGVYHSLALKADGTVVGWGYDNFGQANGAAAGSNNVAIATGNAHSVALKADGTVVGWGQNDIGQANGAAAGGNNVAIAAGVYHSLALKADGTVVGWGQDDYGEANGAAAGGNNVAIAAGYAHSVALKADGTVVAWGRNDYGQANGAAAGSNNVAIAAGNYHSVALKADGTVVAWGRNDYGQAAAPASVYDLNLPVGVSGVVDTPPPGSYQLTYTATNNLGAVGVATRTIVVVDTIPPVLALLGDDPLVQAVGTPFIDPGVIATDACEGDSTESIVVTGNVNSDVLGSYTITYTATDAYGNPGTTNRGVWVCGQPALSNLSSALTATNVIMGTRSATFHAAVTPNGLATGAWFEYGLSTNYAGASPATNLTATFTSSSWSTTLDGLMAGYSYYWRVVATNVLGITVSDWQSLTSSSAGNRAPVANPNTLSTCQGQPASVSAARLLANDADPDGDPLTLTGVTAGSAHGTVGLSGTVVTYTPAEGFTGADSFTYTISDGKGGVATTTVTVTVTSGAGPVQSVAYAAEGVTLRFAGVPAWSYSVQRATDLGGPWTGLHTTNAPPAGVFSYTDATPPSPSGYYRLRRNP